MNIPLIDSPSDSSPKHYITAHPNMEFHTEDSLENRMWLSMSHRWVALFLIEHLFKEDDSKDWSYIDALVYSFQMMAPCGPGRYEYLSPLVGYCLRFPTQESLNAKRKKLDEIHKDPSQFFEYGNRHVEQKCTEAQAKIIIDCFMQARIFPTKHKKISYNRKTALATRWNMLRAYIFHFWLESTTIADLKNQVSVGLLFRPSAQTTAMKKKKTSGAWNEDEGIHGTASEVPGVHSSPNKGKKEFPRRTPPSWLTTQAIGVQGSVSPEEVATLRTSPSVLPGDKEIESMGNAATGTPLPRLLSLNNVDWTTMRLISEVELEQYVRSYLVIRRLDGSDVVSELSPLEVYSANNLHDLVHGRLSGIPPYFPSKKRLSPVTLRIDTQAESYLDVSGKSFYISRKGNENFDEHSKHLPSMIGLQDLCRAIIEHGVVDEKRAVGQYRINIGNGGLNWVGGAPCKLHGTKFEASLKDDCRFDAEEILQTIGRVTEFTWHVACSLQEEAADVTMAPDKTRRQMYARHLNEYLSMDEEVGFEDLTLVVSSLYPTSHQVTYHKDVMNDTLSGYTRTVAFNMVLINDSNPDQPLVVHFQVIGNFRKVVGNYVMSFHKYVSPVANHARQYVYKWDQSISTTFSGRAKRLPTVYDQTPFFLDDTLPYVNLKISEEGKHKVTIQSEYLLMEVGVSRTLSLSMFVDHIVKLQGTLKLDQSIELALAASYLSNPFWFDWTMTTLLERIHTGTFKFGLHPFYDWSETTIEIFGTWQGGPHNRWSPCGGNKETILETFGAQPNASKEERDRGVLRLTKIVSIIWDHVKWINNLEGSGNSPVQDMPLGVIKKAYDTTVKRIAAVTPCQFSHFRLGILTTILSGSGILKSGRHLRHLMFPVKGTASYKHLSHPVADVMSKGRAYALGNNEGYESVSNDGEGFVRDEDHDSFMMQLSSELGFQGYCRDEMECILCESHPMRSLACRDWFRKGGTLYDCNLDGEFFKKEYGRDTKWVKINEPKYTFAYLETPTVVYVPKDPKLADYASQFGKKLREDESLKRMRVNGRMSKTSSHKVVFNDNYGQSHVFCHTSVQSADFYVGSVLKTMDISSFFVLGDGENAVASERCNDFDEFEQSGVLLHYLSKLVMSTTPTAMAAARYHRDPDIDDVEVSFFPGHIDKAFVHSALFVPVGTASFFTLMAIPRHFQVTQNEYSTKSFDDWITTLSSESRQRVDDFILEFDAQAKKVMKQEDTLVRLIFYNECGSLLHFPANLCYHATITPKRTDGNKRDLFIFHPLDGIGRVTT